jgi:hypothetical protein
LSPFLKTILQKNIYIVVAAAILLVAAFGINIYLGSSASVKYFRNSIQSFLQKRESDFDSFLKDTQLISRFSNQEYNQEDLNIALEKKYAILVYQKSPRYDLKFWNNQQTSLPPDSLLQKKDGSYFCNPGNGQYEFIKVTMPGGSQPSLVVVALSPYTGSILLPMKTCSPPLSISRMPNQRSGSLHTQRNFRSTRPQAKPFFTWRKKRATISSTITGYRNSFL